MAGIEIPQTALPLDLLAELEVLASSQHRSQDEVLRDAVGDYVRAHKTAGLRDKTGRDDLKRQAEEAGRHILELRKKNRLPDGMTIEDLLAYGRK